MNALSTSEDPSPLMQLMQVEAVRSPLKGLSLAWETFGVEDDLRPIWGSRQKNLGKWVSDVVVGDYYKSKVPLHHNDFDITLPAGTYFVAEKVTKNKSFIDESLIHEALDDDLVGDFCVMAALHPVTGERMSFSFWANQNGFPQVERVTNQMVNIAIAATGLDSNGN